MSQRPPDDHIWRSAAPRPEQVGTGNRWLGLLFVVVVAVLVLGALVLVMSGRIST